MADEPAAIEGPRFMEEDADRVRVDAVFDLEDPRGQGVHGVGVEHRHGGLEDDRAGVEIAVHEMHGGAADAHAVRERLVLRVEPGERGQKRRVDVHDAIRKRVEQRGADEAHESCKADEADVARAKFVGDGAVVGVAVRKAARIQGQRAEARRARAREARGAGAIGDDDRDRGIEPRCAIASMIACRLLPRPEIKTPIWGREPFAISAMLFLGILLASRLPLCHDEGDSARRESHTT